MGKAVRFAICSCGQEPMHAYVYLKDGTPSYPFASKESGRQILAMAFVERVVTGAELVMLDEKLSQSALPEYDPPFPPVPRKKNSGPRLALVPPPEPKKPKE